MQHIITFLVCQHHHLIYSGRVRRPKILIFTLLSRLVSFLLSQEEWKDSFSPQRTRVLYTYVLFTINSTPNYEMLVCGKWSLWKPADVFSLCVRKETALQLKHVLERVSIMIFFLKLKRNRLEHKVAYSRIIHILPCTFIICLMDLPFN